MAATIAALNGVDLFVFGGGIGENDAVVRAICGRLSWADISPDAARNESAGNPISDACSRCAVRVVASQEGEQTARHTAALSGQGFVPGAIGNSGST